MRVTRLKIENFRAIAEAEFLFQGHALLVGTNNVGKSTICEALDLVLGPDRLGRRPPVEEFDFYNASYLDVEGNPIPAKVEVVLVDLSEELRLACPTHLEYWHKAEKRLLGAGEIDLAASPEVEPCIRLETVASYKVEDDEFIANTYFCNSALNDDGERERISKRLKQSIGFLYLRTLRTGSRALSLERGSLLDIILRMQGAKTGLWERSIKRLRELDPPIGDDASDISPILKNIEARLAQYIPLHAPGDATKLFVSQLTREHLRKTLSFFLTTNEGQGAVPFFEAGTGTLNTLVLALLSFIAEAKPHNVIFAMEEPEIALPPHTQRRIANYLLENTQQCFVTSHSPYVIERFDPSQIHVLQRDGAGTVKAKSIGEISPIKPKHYSRHARRALAEGMLGKGVVVAEGATEVAVLNAVAEKLEEFQSDLWSLDLSGITVFSVDGDGDLPPFGDFFKALGLRTYAFCDKKTRNEVETAKFKAAFDVPWETEYKGMEKLLTEEIPVDTIWTYLSGARTRGFMHVPDARPNDDDVKKLAFDILKSNKGNGEAAILIGICAENDLPKTVTGFLDCIYGDFPKPTPPPIMTPEGDGSSDGDGSGADGSAIEPISETVLAKPLG
ncbi:MAG: AAA family ATPase [Sphingomonadaceae bacterium]|nr:AAA family ATPase [Sphingomonadaceae bacterium]